MQPNDTVRLIRLLRMRCRENKFVAATVVLTLLLVVWILIPAPTPTHVKTPARNTMEARLARQRRCLQGYLEDEPSQKLVDILIEALPLCYSLWEKVIEATDENAGDTKWHITPRAEKQYGIPWDCVAVTIGVGKDIVQELRLREKLHTLCRFHAIDTRPDKAKTYYMVGDFHPLPTAMLYHKNVDKLDMLDFLARRTGERVLDAVWLNMSSTGYVLAEKLVQEGDVTICQLNIRVPVAGFTNRKIFGDLVRKTLEDDRFLIYAMADYGEEKSIALFNYAAPACREKYMRQPDEVDNDIKLEDEIPDQVKNERVKD